MSEQLRDCGPAFPIVTDDDQMEHQTVQWGLSIRDYFAAAALQGMLANYQACKDVCNNDPRYKVKPDGYFNFSEVVAMNCYEFSDAMLAERERKQP